MYNVIGDVGGRYNELMKLIDIMPKEDIILVGDLVDRGPDSKKVVDWAIDNEDTVTVVRGNHEDMMVNAYYGDTMDHLRNGGRMTLQSYGIFDPEDYPTDVIHWMKNLTDYVSVEYDGIDKLFVSHAPWHRSWELGEVHLVEHVTWMRDVPSDRPGVFQIYGHNHYMEKHYNADGRFYGMCIDNTGRRMLAGMHWPTKEIYEVGFEDD